MILYRVFLSAQAEKNLSKIPLDWRRRILEKLQLLKSDPFLGTPLVGKLKGAYKMRIHPYRIIYEIHKHRLTVFVIDIGHRKEIYH